MPPSSALIPAPLDSLENNEVVAAAEGPELGEMEDEPISDEEEVDEGDENIGYIRGKGKMLAAAT